MPDTQKATLTSLVDAARRLGVDRRVVGEIVRMRKIPHFDLGTVKLLDEVSLDEVKGVLSPPESRMTQG